MEVPNTDPSLKWSVFETNHIRISYTSDDEIVEVVVSGYDANAASGCAFWLARLDDPTQQVEMCVSDPIEDVAVKLSGWNLFKYTLTGISAEAYDINGAPVSINSTSATTFKWRVSIYESRKAQDVSDTTSQLTAIPISASGGIQVSASIVHPHGPLVTGTYTISVGGQLVRPWGDSGQSSALPYFMNADALAAGLKAVLNTDNVAVQRVGQCKYGCWWLISYDHEARDIPDLVVDGSGLSGGVAGTSPTI